MTKFGVEQPGAGETPKPHDAAVNPAQPTPLAGESQENRANQMRNATDTQESLMRLDTAGNSENGPLSDEDQRKQNDNAQNELAYQSAGLTGIAEDSGDVIYSSHPISKFAVGPYEFTDSVLKLSADEAAKFDKLLESMPPIEQRAVVKLDTGRAAAIAKSHQNRATQGFDSTAGRAALADLQRKSEIVGTKPVDTPKEV